MSRETLEKFQVIVYRQYKDSSPKWGGFLSTIAWFPVPLLAVVVLLVAASQFNTIVDAGHFLWQPVVVYIAFLLIALSHAWLVSQVFRLSVQHSRVLVFSFGSRNSFVVLPLALALPASFELASIVIVFQILLELFGMVVFVWLVPKKLFP
jgi:arsenite transporter